MSTRTACAQAEVLAGAIALGEAGDGARDAYRIHLSQCRQCCDMLGGEREIERAVSAVRSAREAESWSPSARPMRSRARVRYYLWGWSALAAVLVVALTASALTQHHPTAAPQSVHAQTIARDDARAIAVLDTQTGPRREHQAESLAVGPAIATRRVTVQLTIRAQGNPTRCIVTSSSGDRALDLALCRVATSRRIK